MTFNLKTKVLGTSSGLAGNQTQIKALQPAHVLSSTSCALQSFQLLTSPPSLPVPVQHSSVTHQSHCPLYSVSSFLWRIQLRDFFFLKMMTISNANKSVLICFQIFMCACFINAKCSV